VDRISADLENYSLETQPDFRKVSVDSFVELVGQPTASDEETAETAVAGAPGGSGALDVGLTLGNVSSALRGVVSVNPEDTLATAMTIMRLNDFSQLAVMTSPRTLKGSVTWRSIAKALAHNPDAQLSDAIEPAGEHPFDRDLVDVLDELYARDFVFVRNSTNEVSGIVTTADLVLLYGETATPFFIIGEVDHLLRSFVRDEWTIAQVVDFCDPDGTKNIQSHDDLTFGDYLWMLQDPDRFSSLSWPLDRVTFVNRLDEIREIRNGVMHFDADPLGHDEVASLQNFLGLLRDLRTQNS
jgi:CBS domain-containing protein